MSKQLALKEGKWHEKTTLQNNRIKRKLLLVGKKDTDFLYILKCSVFEKPKSMLESFSFKGQTFVNHE